MVKMKMKKINQTVALFIALLMLSQTGCSRNGKGLHIEADPSAAPVTTVSEGAKTAEEPAADPAPEANPEETEEEEIEAAGPFLPVFSVEGGIYEKTQSVVLSVPEGAPKGSHVTYTTDGNEPTKSAKTFLGSIDAGKGGATVVRAAVFDREEKQIGPIVTNTYIRADEGRFSTLVISLTTAKGNLYGGKGIIDNPRNSGKEWERPCHVEIFSETGERIVSQDAGIRVFGGSSRGLPQKSFRIIARKDGFFDLVKYLGKGSFEYPFFEGRTVDAGEEAGSPLGKYDRLILRNGGNDSIQATAADPETMTLTRDAVANAFMAAHTDRVATQSSRFAAVYLNGEYYGILDMKEDINDDYLRNVYGLDKEKVTVIKSELDTTRHCDEHDNGGSCRFDDVWFYYEVDEGEPTELDEYESMCKAAIDALGGTKEEMAEAYRILGEQIDLENFLQYTAVCLYTCNTDWPHNNIRVWRYTGDPVEGNPYTDGRWRYAARDMDFTFGRYKCLVLPEIYTQADMDNISFTLGNYKNGKYKYDGNYPDSLYLQGLLALCLHDDGFRADFLAFCESLCTDESTAELKDIMDRYAAQIEGEIQYHLKCWKSTVSGSYTPEVWKKNTEDMKKFADERPDYFRKYLGFITEHFS
ncbi:MAG: hypothetical protein E7576_01815 [Ruminococcaceae bacterium]|jgi:hypothetical protein|nr:hypothetical protein [Oscillospiraceae bacterium]